VQNLSYDWALSPEAREYFLALSADDRAALLDRIAYLSLNPWPDWAGKEFVNDLSLDALMALAEAGESYHFIVYADHEWAIVYEVVQPWVFVIYSIARL
jgi:hypothetical protein